MDDIGGIECIEDIDPSSILGYISILSEVKLGKKRLGDIGDFMTPYQFGNILAAISQMNGETKHAPED